MVIRAVDFRVVTLSSGLEFRVQHAGPKLGPAPALFGATHVQRAAAESAWPPLGPHLRSPRKESFGGIRGCILPSSAVQHDVVDFEATSRLAAFLDECSFDHGAQRLYRLYQLYRRLMN